MSSAPPAFSDDGTLRYAYVSGDPTGDRYDSVALWVTLHDAVTGAQLFDGERWNYSTVRPQADGSLFLHLSQNGRDTLFRIDPRARSFRDIGEQGADRPLAELGMAAAAALDAAFAVSPRYRAISPDGTIRVDRESVEWGNTLWV